ncbi:sugar ABC transporter ATP-binding protein [Dactylosporangium fulvum]|uniref:Sugar ABC transporter ATP-binding protein n=1 Tax=Dactylosporangium fulvum TaxID=53359 RepID=A0ABY5W8H1_9ACTN|nr:sugar ABC transporter ATP-binding protein [Dactylosporangium fulvum]UWP85665.1 sugar ABC transporter ATP-binding protein [Dactylosporangium fulvum]
MGTHRHRDGQTNRTLVRYIDISKTYGATHALKDITLDLRAGEVHALVGENGAGKSTCLGVAAGRVAPTTGTIQIDGHDLRAGDPRSSRRAGVCAIYQELTIVPALSAQANVFLGNTTAKYGLLRDAAMRQRYIDLCHELGVAAHPDVPARHLSTADQQMLEIMRAVLVDAKVLLFDEPTASLAAAERQALFSFIDRLKRQGVAIAFVSHNLDEVLDHSDMITVFRNGNLVESRPAGTWDKGTLVNAMLGTESETSLERTRTSHHVTTADGIEPGPILRIEQLNSPRGLQDISFDLRSGEILGIAGLVGSGRSELLRALAGLDPHASGTMTVQGRTMPLRGGVRRARRAGIALLPEDRKHQGLALRMASAENVVLGEYDNIARLGYIPPNALIRAAGQAASSVAFDTKRLRDPAGDLSGGNQQKLMLARWKHTNHPILLADEPTRGVDIGARRQILASLEEIVATGRSLILVSSDLEEVVTHSDRVLVIAGGRIVKAMDATRECISVESILNIVFALKETAR